MDLSVVVPVRNEADNIQPLIDEIVGALEGRVAFEIVYVDDGSEDDSWARLAAARERVPGLLARRHRRRCGQSAAIATGVETASARWIATLDGDGQNDPADIPMLWDMMRDMARRGGRPGEATVIVGYRRTRRDSFPKRAASRIANRVRSTLLGDRTPDTGCGLKLFPRAAFLALPRFDHMHRFLPALFLGHGLEVVSVEVSHRPRRSGVSNYRILDRLWVGIVDLFGVMWLLRRMKVPEIVPDIVEEEDPDVES